MDMRKSSIGLALASLALSAQTAAAAARQAPMIGPRGDGKRPFIRKGHSIAQFNRNTGEPHEHCREIARRMRQQGVGA